MGTAQGSSPNPNRTLVLDGAACTRARQTRGLSREALAARSRGPHPLSAATVKRAESGNPVYLETARRLAELLDVPLSLLCAASSGSAPAPAALRPPGVAVLPLRWLGPPEGSYLAAGLTEDLMTRLARWWFPVVRTPLHPRLQGDDDGSESEPPEAGAFDRVSETLGVRYWVEGSVRRESNQVRVTARLVDASDQRVLWTQNYDRALGDVLAFQDEVAARIVHDLGELVLSLEASRLAGRRGQRLSAWELSLEGAWLFRRQKKATNLRARALLQEALRLDEGLPLAWYTLGMTYRIELLNRWSDDFAGSLRGLYDTGKRFADAHPEQAGHHVIAAYVHMLMGDCNGAADALGSAIELEPNDCIAYSVLGQTLAYRGHGEEALERFEVALRLRPVSPENWQLFTGMALSHVVAENYEESLVWIDRALEMQPQTPVPLATRAVACSYLGDAAAARRAVAALRQVAPNVSIATLRSLGAAAEPSLAERFFTGLKRAGLDD